MKKKIPFSQRLIALIGSPAFFWGIVGLLVLQAAWIALSGRYPMAFDEDFHLGIIRLYAHHLSPFWAHQPAGADMFGAVARDPSYLYHYLMSFPYRFISLFSHDQTIQVLLLRAINIGLFASCLPLYRRLLLKTGASRAVVQACLAVFVLLPIAPLLAAQINYDNLLLPLVALILLLVVKFNEELRHYKRLNSGLLAGILIVCLLTSLVKYAFLPIFLALVIYLLVRFQQIFPSWRKFWLSLAFGLTLLSRQARWLLVVGVLLSAGLFVQRYGVNLVRYHTPVPDCGKVLSVQQCSHYGPWIRDYTLSNHKTDASTSPLIFGADWFYGMWLRTLFTVDGPATVFQTRGPLLLPALGGIVFPVIASVAVVLSGRKLFKRYDRQVLWLLVSVAGLYVAVLWLDEYRAFVHAGQTVAINGRYLLLVYPLLMVIGALGVVELLKGRQALKLAVATVAIVSLVWGGGALTYILRSNDAWYWPHHTVRTVNHAVQRSLGPITPGYGRPTEFMSKN